MQARRTHELDALVRARVAARGVAPSAVAGWLGTKADGFVFGGVAADDSSVFDLASLTKTVVAVTGLLVLRELALDWTRPAQDFLPSLAETPGGRASLRALLSHRSGLMPHRRLYRGSWVGAPVRREILIREAARSVRAGPIVATYSDLGYIVFGAVIEAVSGRSLDRLIEEVLAAPLGLTLGSVRELRGRGLSNFIATEIQPARGGLLRGTVHDDNAWALAGLGCAGHAGVFGTLTAVLRLGGFLAEGFAGNGPLAPLAPVLSEPRRDGLGVGVMFPSGPDSQAGGRAGPNCFGHLGFTGTSLWCDPDRGAATALLCNRVYPRRNKRPDEPGIAGARREVHDALWALADRPLD